MSTITSEIWIDAPADKVWGVLADLGSIYKWNPGVSRSHATSERTQGEGATRHCDMDGDYLEERAFDWQEGESFKIDVYDTSMPLASNVVTFEVRPDNGGTAVAVTVDYKLKYGPVGALMDLLMARRQAQRGFDDMLAGLKFHVETGELVGDALPEAAAV